MFDACTSTSAMLPAFPPAANKAHYHGSATLDLYVGTGCKHGVLVATVLGYYALELTRSTFKFPGSISHAMASGLGPISRNVGDEYLSTNTRACTLPLHCFPFLIEDPPEPPGHAPPSKSPSWQQALLGYASLILNLLFMLNAGKNSANENRRVVAA